MGCEENGDAVERAIARSGANVSAARETMGERSLTIHQGRKADGKKKDKTAAFKEALALVASGYPDLPQDVHVYLHGGAESDAYLFKRRSGDRAQAAFFLGDDLVSYRAVDRGRVGGDAPRGGRGASPRRVADQVYDYYKSTWTVGAQKRASIANALHLFGHVLHQMRAWDDYASCAFQLDLIAKGRGAPRDEIKKEHDLVLVVGHKQVSAAAGASAPRGVLDFAAEAFVGWMVGLPLTEDVILCQLGVGGPVPPESIRHARGERTWPFLVQP